MAIRLSPVKNQLGEGSARAFGTGVMYSRLLVQTWIAGPDLEGTVVAWGGSWQNGQSHLTQSLLMTTHQHRERGRFRLG